MDNSRRLELQSLLERILGSRNVYFQPPSSVKMQYPAIVYNRDDIYNHFADNEVYTQETRYNIIVIDSNPDSIHVVNISKIPRIKFVRHYVADNLYHDVFTLYY